MTGAPLTVASVTVFSDRLQALVRVSGPMRTSAYPGLARGALDWLPGLTAHSCDNPGDVPFATELPDTEIAHLAEHVALDLIRRAGIRGRLRGDTSWDFERDGAGVFRVTLDCPDDVVAVGALKEAIGAVNALAAGERPGDPQRIVTHLRSLHRREREPRLRPRRRS